MTRRIVVIGSTFIIGTIFASFAAFAWSGPPCSDPSGCNVEAPVNVGIIEQRKDGVLGVNGLGVFGNAIMSGTSRYLNFGTGVGSGGYGFRDNGGTMEFKDSGDTGWTPFSDLTGGGGGGGDGGSSSITIPTCAPGEVVTANGSALTCTDAERGSWCGLVEASCSGPTAPSYRKRIPCNGTNITATCVASGDAGGDAGSYWWEVRFSNCPPGYYPTTDAPAYNTGGRNARGACVKE
jgi:hypothetical protein